MTYTLFDAKWIPSSARFVALGNHARGTGAIEVFGLEKGQIVRIIFYSLFHTTRYLKATKSSTSHIEGRHAKIIADAHTETAFIALSSISLSLPLFFIY